MTVQIRNIITKHFNIVHASSFFLFSHFLNCGITICLRRYFLNQTIIGIWDVYIDGAIVLVDLNTELVTHGCKIVWLRKMTQTMVVHGILIIVNTNVLLPLGSIRIVVTSESREEFLKTGNNMISSLALQPQSLSWMFDLSATLVMSHVEHWPIIHLSCQVSVKLD